MVPIELKGHVKDEDLEGIRDQLRAGAEVAEKRLGTGDDRLRLRPVLGFSHMEKWVQLKLTTSKYLVTMRGRTEQIRPLKCGGKIREKLR